VKFVTNHSLGILGRPDEHTMWRQILSSRKIKRACQHAKRILVVAGGHGTEVDVLVELHGLEILDKIWFNDLLVCYTNDIRVRYPQINIAKGDFLSLKFEDEQGKSMKFDVVVGNPPYQDPKNDKRMLWNQIVDKMAEITEDDGYIGVVTPSTWLTASTNIHNSYRVFEEKQVEEAVIFDKDDSPF